MAAGLTAPATADGLLQPGAHALSLPNGPTPA